MLSNFLISLLITMILVSLIVKTSSIKQDNWGSWLTTKQDMDRPKKGLEVLSFFPIETGLTETTQMLNRTGVLDISIKPTDKSFEYMLNAVGLGHIQCILTAFNFGDKSNLPIGVDLYTNYPFGLDDNWKIRWLFQTKSGQGIQRLNNFLLKRNVYALPIQILNSQVTGWTNQTLSNSAHTWKNLKMRSFGFSKEIYSRLGAQTHLMLVNEIPKAYKNGEINFYEYATLTADIGMGLDQLGAKNYYITGYMEPSSVIYLIFNLDFWNSLSTNDQQIIRNTARVNLEEYLRQSHSAQKQALTQISQSGVKILQVPPNALLAVYNEWQKYVAEKRKIDSFFDQTIQDFHEFIEEEKYWDNVTGSWRDLLKFNRGDSP